MEYMKKKSLGIQEIKYGEVHCFYPLKFENDKLFEVLCDSILHSKVFFRMNIRIRSGIH